MKAALIADTGGILQALACLPNGEPAFPAFEAELRSATAIIVPALVLAEVDYFLRKERKGMRKFVAELFDPATTYEFEDVLPTDVVRALELDGKFHELELGLVDGTVAAVAERRRIYRILTTDREDFGPLRVGPRFERAFTLVP